MNEGDGLDAWGVFLLGRIGKISRPSERDTFLAGFKAGRAKQPSQTSVPLFDWAMQIAAIIADEDWTREEVIWAAQKIAEFAKEQPSQTRAALSSTEECSEIEARTGLKRADTESRLAEEYSFLRWVNEAEALKIIWQALVDSELKRDAAAVPAEDRPAPTPQEKMDRIHEQRNADLDLTGAPEKE